MSKTCAYFYTLMVELCSCLFFSIGLHRSQALHVCVGIDSMYFCKLTCCSATAWSRMCTHVLSLGLSSVITPVFLVSISATSLCALHNHNGQVELPLEALLNFFLTLASRKPTWRNGNKKPMPRNVPVGSQGNDGRNLVFGRGTARTYPMKRPSPA